MKQKAISALVWILTVVLFLMVTSCGRQEPNVDHVTTESEQEEGPVESKAIELTLRSKDTEGKIKIENDLVSIVSLKTESGRETVGEGTTCTFPSSYTINGTKGDFQWRYTGYEPYDDGKGGEGFKLLFKDETLPVTYEWYAVARPALSGPFEFFAYLYNKGTVDITYQPGNYFRAKMTGESAPVAWTFSKESGIAEGRTIYNGQRFEGTGLYKRKLIYGNSASAIARVNQNWNDNGSIPMIYVDYETYGAFFALEWTNGRVTASGTEDDKTVSLSVCLANRDFTTRVPAGSAFYMPSVYLGVYDGDVDVGSNVFKHWFLACKAPANLLEDPNEPYTQEDMQLGYDVARYGIQQVKWDYGWWSDKIVGAWRSSEGLLEVHNSAYLGVLKAAGCETLREFSDKANDAGVKLTLYALLKDTHLDRPGVPTSVGEYGHPEWFSEICVTGVGHSADLGNKECVDFFKQYLSQFFTSNRITTWRSDFEPICRSSGLENRHFADGNDVQYWCTVGFGELVDYLAETVPGFRYESCSSGGSMKDFFTMSKASVIQNEDSADFMSVHMAFYDTSYCFPPAQIQLGTNALTFTPGSPYYAGIGDYLYGFRCTLTGAVMLSNWEGATEEDVSYWPYYIDNLYNKVMKPLIKYGDLYHILPRPDGVHWDGLEYIDADTENEIKGLVMLWKPTDTEGKTKTVFLRGLYEDTLYDLRFEDRPDQNARRTGADLMQNGLSVTIEEESGSEMIWISEADPK